MDFGRVWFTGYWNPVVVGAFILLWDWVWIALGGGDEFLGSVTW